MGRSDADKTHMGLTSWEKVPEGKILRADVVVAKNYLQQEELEALSRIVSMYLDYAENMALRKMPMTMEDWATKLDAFLQFNEQDILDNSGNATAEMAKAFALSEFEKYRVVQDRLFNSDFDKMLTDLTKKDDSSQ